MSHGEDYVHVDQVAEVACENGWLTPEDIAGYITDQCKKSKNKKAFWLKLKALLEEEGFSIEKLPKNPSVRKERE
jgi:hypothetical protein